MHGKIKDQNTPVNLSLASGLWLLLIAMGVVYFFFKEKATVTWGSAPSFPPMTLFLTLVFLVVFRALLLRTTADNKRRAEIEAAISGINMDAFIVIRPDRTIDMCNDALQRMFGYTPGEILQQTTDLLYFDRRIATSPPKGREIYESLERDGYHIGLATGRRKNGDTFPLEIITGTLSGRKGAALLLRDITERVRAEQERRELDALRLRQEKSESLALLAGGVAHDFKNLLSAIATQTYIGLRPSQPPEVLRESLDEIKQASDQATELCRHLLTYAGKGEFVAQTFDMREAVRLAVRVVRHLLPSSVRIELHHPEEPVNFTADMAQIQQVTINLILNAGQAIGAVGGLVTVEIALRDCDAESLRGLLAHENLAPGRHMVLSVTDTGCGMNEATRRRIFDPFFTTKPDGQGLGLASVQGIVRAHKGGIQVESTPGQGTTFRIFLPLSQPVQ
ncbi:MAG: two-component system sensor histidine kinase NtrB [Kiritimatiellia bacterium]